MWKISKTVSQSDIFKINQKSKDFLFSRDLFITNTTITEEVVASENLGSSFPPMLISMYFVYAKEQNENHS